MALSELLRLTERQRSLLSDILGLEPDGRTDDLKKLRSICEENLTTIEEIEKKQTGFLDRACKPILEKAQTVSEQLQTSEVRIGTTVRKSFEAIYVSLPARESELQSQRLVRNKQYDRALMIQNLGCDKAMVLAGSMIMSTWAHNLSELKFKHIIKNIPQLPQECIPELQRILGAWANEEPLMSSTAFRNSLTGEDLILIAWQN